MITLAKANISGPNMAVWIDSKYIPLKVNIINADAQLTEFDVKFNPDNVEINANGRDTGKLPRTQDDYYGYQTQCRSNKIWRCRGAGFQFEMLER
jgi:hypothetical protein